MDVAEIAGRQKREADMLLLYKLHLTACGASERSAAVDSVPTTRTDLRKHYVAILDGTVERPKWAGPAEAPRNQDTDHG